MKKFKSKIKHPPNTYIELTSYSQTLANVKLMTYRWVLADHSSMTIILRTNQLREHKPTVMMNTRMFSRKITGLSLLVEKTSGLSRGMMPRQRDSSGKIVSQGSVLNVVEEEVLLETTVLGKSARNAMVQDASSGSLASKIN